MRTFKCNLVLTIENSTIVIHKYNVVMGFIFEKKNLENLEVWMMRMKLLSCVEVEELEQGFYTWGTRTKSQDLCKSCRSVRLTLFKLCKSHGFTRHPVMSRHLQHWQFMRPKQCMSCCFVRLACRMVSWDFQKLHDFMRLVSRVGQRWIQNHTISDN